MATDPNARRMVVPAHNPETGEGGLVLLTPSPTCQASLGLAGPGSASLSLCGGDLSAGTRADLELVGAAPNAPALFALGQTFQPTALLGGTIATYPPAGLIGTTTDALGAAHILGLPGGGGPATLYVQAVYFDALLPQAFGFSNALRVELLL